MGRSMAYFKLHDEWFAYSHTIATSLLAVLLRWFERGFPEGTGPYVMILFPRRYLAKYVHSYL